MVDLEGNTVTMGQAETVSSLFDIPRMDVALLGSMKTVSCYVDFSNDVDGDLYASAESPSVFQVTGDFSLFGGEGVPIPFSTACNV